jgi:hypothetical protein
MIIDIHTHLMWAEVMENRPGTVEAADEVLAAASRAGIERVCQLGNFQVHATLDDVRRVNDLSIAMVRRHPDRIHGLCYINPNHPWKDVEAEVRRCIDAGLCGIKLEVEVNAQDCRLDPLMELAAELDVWVLHHAWYKTTERLLYESTPADIACLASRHPGTTIVMAHLTAAGMRGVLDIQPYENILVDTSGSQPQAGVIEYAVMKLGAHRVLFGSDVCGRDFSAQLGRVMGADITDEQRRQIFYDNAARLLKLEPKEARA